MKETWKAERLAWDGFADEGFDPQTLTKVRAAWRPVHETILDPLGDVGGRRLLDCGCGVGFLSRVAASRGAIVTGFDVSSGSILAGEASASEPASNLSYVTAMFERLPFPDGAFNLATGQFILHHVDLGTAAAELARVVSPGGQISFLETWQDNPLIRVARGLRGRFGIAKYGTDDESPLIGGDLATLERAGFDVSVRFPIFMFFRLIDHNLLKGRKLFRPIAMILKGMDLLVGKIAFLRRFSYYALIVGVRREDA